MPQGVMGPVAVAVLDKLLKHPLEMPLVEDEHAIKEAAPTQRAPDDVRRTVVPHFCLRRIGIDPF